MLAYGLPPLFGSLASGAPRFAAIALIACAIAFAFWAKRTLGSAFTPFPRPVESGQLAVTGPFAFVRHPIYTSMVAMCASWAWLWQSEVGAGCAVVLFAFFDQKARREERWLAEAYAGYGEYRARVKRLVPWIY
ncbi:MAG TPA: isoprenylcysteine carboxylmethyltransferase family protein [Usitatibacter sp.]|nr:isoprenylcysteine carboxylmethyltransferase family protein [Usitatibacter sp.]